MHKIVNRGVLVCLGLFTCLLALEFLPLSLVALLLVVVILTAFWSSSVGVII